MRQLGGWASPRQRASRPLRTSPRLLRRASCRLNPALPALKDDEGNDVQFRRTLLNKCQVRARGPGPRAQGGRGPQAGWLEAGSCVLP